MSRIDQGSTEMRNSRRVLQLVTQLERAGAQTVAAWLEDALPEPGQFVATYFIYKKYSSDLFSDDRCLAADKPRTIRSAYKLASNFMRLRALQPDTIIAHTHYAMAASILLKLFLRPTRLILVHHWPQDRYPTFVRALLFFARMTRLVSAEVMVAESLGIAKALYIPNPMPPSMIHARRVPASVDLLCVARHSYEKGLDVAVTAMQGLPGRRLTLLGTGPLTEHLKRIATEKGVLGRVDFAGAVAQEDVRRFMASANAVIMPSRWEALPMALLEAVASDAALIVSDIPAHQFLKKAGAAIFFEPESDTDLAKAIQHISKLDPQAEMRLTDGRAKVRADYAPERVVAQWRQLLGMKGGHDAAGA